MLSGYNLDKLIEDVGDAYKIDEADDVAVLIKDSDDQVDSTYIVASLLVELYGFLIDLKDSSQEQLLDYFKPK